MHHQMGDKAVQKYGLSEQDMVVLRLVLEREWQAAGDSGAKKVGVSQLACFVFFGYTRALRGEESRKIELTGVIKYFADGATTPPHAISPLIGRFTQEEVEHQHFLPVATVTGSGLILR
jgi:hypothetical protein